MKIVLVPSTVMASGPTHYQFTTSAVINDTIAVDAGSLGFYLSPQEQARIRHVFLSHTHIDHVASLPIFVENAYEGKADCVRVCPYGVFEIGTLPAEQRGSLSIAGRLKGFFHRYQQAFAVKADACHACGLCVKACPEHAITLARP